MNTTEILTNATVFSDKCMCPVEVLRHTGANAGSLKHNVLHYLASVKAAHVNQLMIKARVSSRKKQETQRSRIGFDAVISSIQLLARQGMSLLGHGEEKDTANIGKSLKLFQVSIRM